MPKVELTCVTCQKRFERWPAFVRHAEKRGSPIRFCSRACMSQGRTDGLVSTRPRTGRYKTCEICGTKFWCRPSSERLKCCSEACRQESIRTRGHENRGTPRPARLRGREITCRFCGDIVYRKASMISRNIAITCGKQKCVSAYGRSLWGLGPRTPELIGVRGPRKRAHNFTAKQRIEWLEGHCARCGTTENLALDHIVPVCAGGKSDRANAQTLCQPCNNWKAKHVDRPLARQQALSGGHREG